MAGLQTHFEAMDYAIKMRAFILGELALYAHGSRVAELLFGLDGGGLTALVAKRMSPWHIARECPKSIRGSRDSPSRRLSRFSTRSGP